MSGIDFISDLTRAFRIGKKVLTGESTLANLVGEVVDASSAPHVQCSKAQACTANDGHEGGCTFAAPTEGT